jgi:hypothetical protein
MRLPRFAIGVQHISQRDLERARAKGRRVNAIGIGWIHVSHRVSRELADAALGRIVVLGGRSGLRRLKR